MKLASKYELLDPVTTGVVESFVARDLATGERVLAFIFESGPLPADPPPIEWTLEKFEGMAPAPPGKVVDAGRYGATGFAYLVTKTTAADELQKWVIAYESFQRAREGRAPEPTVEIASAISDSGSPSTSSAPGSITAVFSAPTKAAEVAAAMPRPSNPPAPVVVSNRIPTQPKESLTDLFRSVSPAGPSANAALGNDEKKGDFTDFFRGPFTGKPTDTPNLAPRAPQSENAPGEFTKIFGVSRSHAQEQSESALPSDAALNEPGGFTQLFASPTPEQNPAAYKVPLDPREEKPISSENPFIFDNPTWEPQAPVVPEMPVASKAPPQPLRAAGPSEYTMIVSGGRAPSTPEEPPLAGGTSSPGAKLPAGFAMPKAPGIPPLPIPKMPAPPPMPHLPEAPKMPAITAPKAPEAPATPKPPVSYMPLVLAMTVLFFAGAMLVLYFALKH
jgi:hypothetical protein